jgi:hypothetical protein
MNFTRGQILICTSPQKTGCGILYIKENSIIKAAEDSSEGWNWVEIYRNRREENSGKTFSIHVNNFRAATEEETKFWYEDVHYIQPANVESE